MWPNPTLVRGVKCGCLGQACSGCSSGAYVQGVYWCLGQALIWVRPSCDVCVNIIMSQISDLLGVLRSWA